MFARHLYNDILAAYVRSAPEGDRCSGLDSPNVGVTQLVTPGERVVGAGMLVGHPDHDVMQIVT